MKPELLGYKHAQTTGTASLMLAVLLAASAANAQSVPPAAVLPPPDSTIADAEIVVTGTRIANRPDLQAASPVSDVTAETLQLTNSTTVESYLTQLPQFVASLTGTTNNGADGFATIDLRSLGSKRTLVLVDGKRMTPGDINGAVDIDSIPSALLKRVDILTGGASSVYGADAISGVVNFILDDTFTGITADVSDKITTYGDGKQFNADIVVGLKVADEGHLVLAAQYTDRDGVYQSARKYSDCCSYSSNTVPTAIDLADGNRFQVNSAGNFVPFYNLYNINPTNYLQVPLGKYSLMGLFSIPMTDHIQFYARGSYTNSKITEILAPTATGGNNFVISPTNPYLNAANYNLIFGDSNYVNADGTANVGIRRRIVETETLGGRDINYSTTNTFGIIGFRGDLGGDFKFDASAQYGVSNENQDLLNDISYTRTQQALSAVQTPNGIQCADPSGGCVPLNLFTTSAIPSDALNFILENGSQTNHYSQFVGGGNISGTPQFLKSPFADKAAAVDVGVEYRREAGNQLVSQNYGSGDMIYFGPGTAVPSANFNVKEIYGELKMPVITDRPFIEQFNIEGGIRYSSYRNNTTDGSFRNNTLTFKGGGDWTAVRGLRLRAIFNRAIRDPDLYELNAPMVQGSSDVLTTDPCAGINKPSLSPATAAKCIAQGAPAALVNGNAIQDVIANQVNAITGGNGALKPETADTITLGAVFSPPALPGLHVTIDYYKIKVSDFITNVTAQQVSDACFDSNIDCNLIVRNPVTGQLTGSYMSGGAIANPGVIEVLQNLAALRTAGVDVSADYRFRLAHDSSLTLAINGTYVTQWAFQTAPDSGQISCLGKFGNLCDFGSTIYGNLVGNPIPRWKHVASANYQNGPFSLYLVWRLIGAVHPDANTDAPNIPSYSYFDSTVSLKVAEHFTLRVGVQNMFDIDPPIVGAAAGQTGVNSGNTFPQVYDALGRTFFANLNVRF